MGGGLFPHFLADAAANLPMFHAFGILNDVLKQLAEEGCFECKGRELGRLIEASKEALDWEDLDAIKKGKDARNGVAHEGKLLGRGDCWALIDVVRSELGAWGVI